MRPGPSPARPGGANRAEALVAAVREAIPAMQRRAEALDQESAFPAEDIAALRDAGLLASPLPEHLGGLGAGTEPGGTNLILGLLRLLGRGNLAVAR